MKKILFAILMGLFTLAMATGALAEQVNVFEQNKLVKSVIFPVGKDRYYVNGDTKGVQMDAKPYISPQGRTFVPVRFLGNALGVTNENINWDGVTRKAKLTLGTTSAELTVGQKQIITNGQAKAMDVAPELQSGRTFLPARFVAEALGYQVDFINGLVVAWPQGAEKPAADILAIQQQLGQQVEQGQQAIVDVSQVGKPVAGQSWAEWVLKGKEYVTINPAELKGTDYKLSESFTVKDILINKDTIEVTLNTPSPVFNILFVDDQNRFRPRMAGSNDPADNRKFVFKVVDNDYDDINKYPTAEVSKIKSIIVGSVGNVLEVTNPYYGGGK